MLNINSLLLSTILLLVVRKCNGFTPNIDRITCSTLNVNIVQRAYTDMVAMAQVAYDRTVAARDGTSAAGDQRVVSNTFITYFGAAADGRHFRLSNLIGVLKDIKDENFDLTPSLLIACDDTYFTESTTDEAGNPLPAGVYQPVNERVSPPRWYPIGMERCSDTSPTGGFLGAMSESKINWITICPRIFSRDITVASYTNGEDASPTGKYINDVRPLGVTLMHELLHLLYPEFMAGPAGGVVTYEVNGFQACAQLQQTNIADTIHMPDCISLYALSLYMTGNDWSSGYPVVNPTQ